MVYANVGAPRNGVMTIAGNAFDLDQQGATPRVPTAAFRDPSGGIRLILEDDTIIHNGGGLFASDPESSQDLDGDTFVVARDTYNSVWAITFFADTKSWSGWGFGGGLIQGIPAVAVATDGTAYIAVRDTWNSYWLTSYTMGSGFGSWTYLAGIFSTDPVMAASPDGSVYIVGKDDWNALWAGHYIPGSGFQGWQYGGGIVKGKPSVACGTDSVAYIAIRDMWDSLWISRVEEDSWLGWSYGGGIMSADPQIASTADGEVHVALLDTWGGVWHVAYPEGASNGWGAWTFTNGVLKNVGVAGVKGDLFIAGVDLDSKMWWFDSSDTSWTPVAGTQDLVAGQLAAAPR